MRYDIDIACTSYLTLHEQKLRIKSFLIEYFGTVHFSLVETGSSITAVQEETVFFEWVNAGRPARTTKELFLFEWTEQERWSEYFLLKCSFFNRLEVNSRQKQFEKIVLQIKEHMEHPTLTLYITQKDNLIDVRQFHRRGDGNIGYGLYPYAEDEKGHWRDNLGVGLWIYRKDFHLLYEGIKEVYPLKVKGFENFDHTGMNFISKSEWKVILNHWSILAISNPSSAEFIDYVGRWVVATLEHVDEIAIEGNL
ncbi:hypothetical protein YDYSY3_34320 [Paenibacillus chitinolyticus]|uniref:hypothetical protein n=1 Tax=Paenibacillus chitinolyticus TaxID=79263 RepID=UPI0026E4A426|nr:hypothetical protein [Paenibacillus chitinolyticus]GKS12432.1 hypothetical protein YDYSY3_34320 [Paenibacillus chitinolyticus]